MMKTPSVRRFLWKAAALGAAYAFAAFTGAGRREPEMDAPFGARPTRDGADTLHRLRANEPGRGRGARTPLEIPRAGWRDIIWRAYSQVLEDRILTLSAGVVFYALLALFPTISAIVSLYGLFATPAAIHEHIAFLRSALPGDFVQVVDDQIARVIAKGGIGLSFAFSAGFALALWSANAGVKATIDALNITYEETEKRGFLELNAISLAFTLCAVIAATAAIGALVAAPFVLKMIGMQGISGQAIEYGRWPLLAFGVLITVATLYRHGPSRTPPKWRWVAPGCIGASAVWLPMSWAYSWYIANFANYDATYGSMGAVIGLMMWMWLSISIFLIGAEFNSEIEHQTAMDSTIGDDKPIGERGATMADTIGKSTS